MSQPVMLVQSQTSRKREIRANSDKQSAPLAVIHIEVVLLDPALFQLQMPAIFFLISDSGQNPCRFSRLENADDLIGLGPLEVAIDKLVAASCGSVQDRGSPFLRAILHPVVELRGDLPQHVAADRIEFPVSVEEPNHPLLLLEGLD